MAPSDGSTTAVEVARRRRRARVVLIRPNTIVMPRSLSWYGPVPPIGLAYVAAALRSAGHEVTVVDAPGEAIDRLTPTDSPVGTLLHCGLGIDEIVSRIPDDTELVGITHMFLHEWPHLRSLARAIRAHVPDARIVLGGENATAYHPQILAEEAIDACVLGEGEATAVAVADAVAHDESLDGIVGVATRAGSTRADRLRTSAVADVSRPAWDLFPLDQYFRLADFFGVHRGRSMPVLATRGCPYRCSFCSSPQMWTTRYVTREPEDVVDEIVDYIERYGVENVNFADLTAITKRQWTLRFCDALERRAPGLRWQLPVGTRAEALDQEVLQRLFETGCRNITYAPEAGGRRMLEVYDKRVDLERLVDSLATAHRVGLVVKLNVIVGHPEERWGDLARSLLLLVRAALRGADDAAVMMFGPYPGSADFDALVRSGAITLDDEYAYTALSWSSGLHRSYNPRLGRRRLRAVQMAMLLTFYTVASLRHPMRLVRYVEAWFTRSERTQVDALLRSKRRGYQRTPAIRLP